MRIQIDPAVANDPAAYQWLDRILYKIVDGWHVWDTTNQLYPEQLAATTWVSDSAQRVRDMLVASIQRAAWTLKPHGRPVRVTTNPSKYDELSPEDTARLSEEPLCILVENRFSDGAFVKRIVEELDGALDRVWRMASKPVRIDGPGGKGEMAKVVERRAAEVPYRPRLVAVIDSDRRSPNANPSRDAQRLHRICRRLNLPCWILAKREAENYLTMVLLSARPDVGPDHRRIVSAWDRLTDDKKNFIDMKYGLQNANTAPELGLFAGLSPADRNALHSGFGRNVVVCWGVRTKPAKSELAARGQGDLEFGLELIRSALWMSDSRQSRTDVVTEVMFLGKLVERIEAGKIRVPRFQRAFAWKQADLISLLDSILHGYPIGSILVWDTAEKIESTARIGPVPIGPPSGGVIGYLIDGQQRLSTLVGTLRLTDAMDDRADSVDWRVYFNLDTRAFHRSPPEGPHAGHFPINSLLNTAGFFEACRLIESEVTDPPRRQRWLDEADRLANVFRDYQIPLIRIREADLDSAVTVFARLNRRGRKMAADEMVSALTYQKGQFHLAQNLDEFKSELDKKGFGNLDRVVLLRAVLAALDLDIYAKDWADLMVKTEVRSKLPSAFESAAHGIRRALEYLHDLGITSDRLLPYGLQLVFIGEFFRRCQTPQERALRMLDRWFWVTSFTGWFGGVNTAKASQALSDMQNLAAGSGTEFGAVDLDAPAQPFPGRFDGRSARVRAFLLYLASLNPRSLKDAECELDAGILLSTLGTRALGHVSSSQPQLGELVGSPANRMFVDQEHVGQAFGALRDMSDDLLRVLLPTHGFPADSISRLRTGDRIGLISERLRNLIEGERTFMRSHDVTLPTQQTGVTIADSDVSDEDFSETENYLAAPDQEAR